MPFIREHDFQVFCANAVVCVGSLTALLLMAGCATTSAHRAVFDGSAPVVECPEELSGLVRLSAEALPIAIPDAIVREGPMQTEGQLARRLAISVTRSGPLRADRITWSALSIAALGGTFRGWTALRTPFTTVDIANPGAADASVARDHAAEAVSVAFALGEIKVVRSAHKRTDLSGLVNIDVLVMPGGVEVDHTVLRATRLWTAEGQPLPADAVEFDLVPARHPPGLDTVDASIDMQFIVQRGSSGDEWVCSSEERVRLVDDEAVRQPLWDIGVAAANSRRTKWLALFDQATGIVRLVFDSPAAANSFASWVKVTGATTLGRYSLVTFEPSFSASRRRPFAPLDAASIKTRLPVGPTDMTALQVGALGES